MEDLASLFFDAEEALLVFDDAGEDLAPFVDLPAPVVFDDADLSGDFALPPVEVPPVLDFAEAFLPPFWSVSTRSPTASAATLRAVKAAPVAAPTRISPATSLAVSRIEESCFLVDFFAPDFDFAAPVELFADVEAFDLAGAELFAGAASLAADFDFVEAESFAAVFDFAGAELFAVFGLSFFAAIFNLPLDEF